MHTVLYIIWYLIPAFYFIMALWGTLEQISKSAKKHRPKDFFMQGIFTLACVLVAIFIDTYWLESLVTSFSPDFIPLEMYQVLLLPAVLLIGAYIVGGSKPIKIEKSSLNSRRKR